MSKKEKIDINDINQLPLTLNVQEIASILRISLANAYDLTKQDDFPKLLVQRRIVIPRDAFLKFAKITS